MKTHTPRTPVPPWSSVCVLPQVPEQYGTIRAVAEGRGEEFLVGTSRNFLLRGTFNDGFQVEVQVRPLDPHPGPPGPGETLRPPPRTSRSR